MPAADWVARVTSINQWHRRGERAPHKPLLLLYALGRWQRTGSGAVGFADAEGDLRRLLADFGPPRPTSPAYPFHHLTSDGLWAVRTPSGPGSPGPRLGALRGGAVGELPRDLLVALDRDPALVARLARALLDANFPPTLHQDLLDAVGLALDAAEAPPAYPRTRRRDPAFRELVLRSYEYRCAVCGFDGQLGHEAVGIEAAHVRWWAAGGPDELGNAVALCALHHKLLDRGAIGLTPAGSVAVSSHFVAHGPEADARVLALVDRPLLAPQAGTDRPHPTHVAWHTREVFRGPARLAG